MTRETDLMNLMDRLERVENRVGFQERLEGGASGVVYTSCEPALTSTNFDGDTINEATNTDLDFNTEFSVPTDAIAVAIYVQVNSATNGRLIRFRDSNDNNVFIARVKDTTYTDYVCILNLDSNGCAQYNTASSDVEVIIRVIGYWSSGTPGSGGTVNNHDHSGDSGDGGTFDAANLNSGASTDGQVLTSDGAGGAAWENPPAGGAVDAGDVTYTPAVATDWDSDTDPGNVDDALDQLAERVDDLEAGGGGGATDVLQTQVFS